MRRLYPHLLRLAVRIDAFFPVLRVTRRACAARYAFMVLLFLAFCHDLMTIVRFF